MVGASLTACDSPGSDNDAGGLRDAGTSTQADSGPRDAGDQADAGDSADAGAGPMDGGSPGTGTPSTTLYRTCDVGAPDCSSGEDCIVLGFGDGFCVPGCASIGNTEQCPDGFSCQMYLSPTDDFRCLPQASCDAGCDVADECVEIGCLGSYCVPASHEIPPRSCG